jgi:hypothetical protein
LRTALIAPGALGFEEGTGPERILYEGNRRLATEGFHAFELAGGSQVLSTRAGNRGVSVSPAL